MDKHADAAVTILAAVMIVLLFVLVFGGSGMMTGGMMTGWR